MWWVLVDYHKLLAPKKPHNYHIIHEHMLPSLQQKGPPVFTTELRPLARVGMYLTRRWTGCCRSVRNMYIYEGEYRETEKHLTSKVQKQGSHLPEWL